MKPIPKRLRILTSYKSPLCGAVHRPRVGTSLIQLRGKRGVGAGIEIRRDRASASITHPPIKGRGMLAPFQKGERKPGPRCTIPLSLVRKDAKVLCFYLRFSSTKKELTTILDYHLNTALPRSGIPSNFEPTDFIRPHLVTRILVLCFP